MNYRKLIIISLIAVLLCGCGKTEKAENPYRIKPQIWESYRQDKTETIRTEYIYDDNGNLLRHKTQRLSGDTMTVSCCEYIKTDRSISGSIPE